MCGYPRCDLADWGAEHDHTSEGAEGLAWGRYEPDFIGEGNLGSDS